MEDTNVLKISVRNVPIDVYPYVGNYIPFLKVLLEQKTKEIVELNLISPSFMIHIIDHYTQQKKLIHLKMILDSEYDIMDIKNFLKYLGLDQLLKQLYQPIDNIDGKKIVRLVDDFSIVGTFRDYFKFENNVLKEMNELKFKFIDGSDTSQIDYENTLHEILDIILEDNVHYILIQREFVYSNPRDKTIKYLGKYQISKKNVIQYMDSYFVSTKIYLKMLKSFVTR